MYIGRGGCESDELRVWPQIVTEHINDGRPAGAQVQMEVRQWTRQEERLHFLPVAFYFLISGGGGEGNQGRKRPLTFG